VTRYVCEFVNKSGRRRTIVVELDEISEEYPDTVIARAYALQHAYRDMPRGFLHTAVERVTMH
jgi:hypothetical protein